MSAFTPALAAADGTTNALPVSAYVVVMARNTPPFPAAFSRLPASSVTMAVPLRTMSTTVRQALADRRSEGLMKFPALHTTERNSQA